MNWFPQIGAGSMAQFPLKRKRQWRVIENVLASGERIALPDLNGGQVEWLLTYQELTDAEITRVTDLFAASNGDAGSFGFVDPFANLLGWSEDLARADWQMGLLTATGGFTDPVGTARAWTLQNPGPGEQTLSQSLDIPGDYTVCFSVYVWAATAGTLAILRDRTRIDLPIGAQWKRIQISGTGVGGATQSTFALALGGGKSVRVFGLQVEAQPWPSPYRPSGVAAGILEETRFSAGDLAVTSIAPGLSACQLRLTSRI